MIKDENHFWFPIGRAIILKDIKEEDWDLDDDMRTLNTVIDRVCKKSQKLKLLNSMIETNELNEITKRQKSEDK